MVTNVGLRIRGRGGEHGRKSIEFKVEGPGYKVWRKVNDYELGV